MLLYLYLHCLFFVRLVDGHVDSRKSKQEGSSEKADLRRRERPEHGPEAPVQGPGTGLNTNSKEPGGPRPPRVSLSPSSPVPPCPPVARMTRVPSRVFVWERRAGRASKFPLPCSGRSYYGQAFLRSSAPRSRKESDGMVVSPQSSIIIF